MISEDTLGKDLDKQVTEDLLRKILKSQKQWQTIIDAITDYIFVIDKDCEIKKANISFSQRFGRHPRDIIGMKADQLFQVENFHPCSVLEKVITSGSPVLDEINIGSETYMLSIFPTIFGSDEVFVCIMKDITEVKRLKDQIYNSYKLTSMGRLVSGVAHEINNPLTGILGYSEMLMIKIKDEDIKKELGKIYKAAERCRVIVDSLLCFSRQQVLQKNLENINEIIDKTIELRIYWLKTNGIELVKEYGEIPFACVDSQQIHQVILNILMNAEQAIIESGRKGKIAIFTEYDNSVKQIIIKISDNGTGIPQANISKIFDPFFTTKPVNKGTGLGLSIAYGIIKEHGGVIKVDSKEGEGAVFIIYLPLK